MPPYDEEDISPEAVIIRRIDPKQHIVWDENNQCHRISSKAYSPSSGDYGGMSVDIEAKIIAAGVEPAEFVTTPVFTGSVQFSANSIRNLNLWIGYEPVDDNPHHGEVWGNPRPNKFTNGQKRGLRQEATWYVQLENVELV
ncbi:hypothetical protein [Sulfitobacter sp. D7]|uniref:hypothetical protein n=1 Tax=Sulfitobacter sp. D7 TaxID=1968541 RepID=UPI0020C780D1|nr:hypothetical protein [Sulfitobacter sp. D7]